MTKLADELGALAKDSWQDISNTPVDTPVRVKAGNMTFMARLVPDASMTSEEESCDQWQAEHEGEHPPCWSGGACWESNEDEAMSLQPTHWQPIAALRQPDAMSQSERDARAVMNPQSGAVSAVTTGQVFNIGVGHSRIGGDHIPSVNVQPDAVPGDLVERLKLLYSRTDSMLAEAAAAIQSLTAERDAALAANYKSFTDGMKAAAQICGSLAETTYDDADAFAAATGCEASIMRMVKQQRAEQPCDLPEGSKP